MKSPVSLSVAMIASNEEGNLARSLPAVKFADEVIVVENDSTDRTVAVAESLGAKVITHPWEGYARQRNFSISQCRGEWVLILDADEVIPPETAEEIRQAIKRDDIDGYNISYRNFIGTRQLKHGGWTPDWHLRLVRKRLAHFPPTNIHETIQDVERVGYLKNSIVHYTYRDVEDWLKKVDRYTDLEAPKRRFSLLRLLFKPPALFIRSYVGWSGWRNGWLGVVASGIGAWYGLQTELKRFRRRGHA